MHTIEAIFTLAVIWVAKDFIWFLLMAIIIVVIGGIAGIYNKVTGND